MQTSSPAANGTEARVSSKEVISQLYSSMQKLPKDDAEKPKQHSQSLEGTTVVSGAYDYDEDGAPLVSDHSGSSESEQEHSVEAIEQRIKKIEEMKSNLLSSKP